LHSRTEGKRGGGEEEVETVEMVETVEADEAAEEAEEAERDDPAASEPLPPDARRWGVPEPVPRADFIPSRARSILPSTSAARLSRSSSSVAVEGRRDRYGGWRRRPRLRSRPMRSRPREEGTGDAA
jgi:hypothetical protein